MPNETPPALTEETLAELRFLTSEALRSERGEIRVEMTERASHDAAVWVGECEGKLRKYITPTMMDALLSERERDKARIAELETPRPFAEWHEDIGNVLWWQYEIQQPPYVGTPLDIDWPFSTDEDDEDLPPEDEDRDSLWWTPLNPTADAVMAFVTAASRSQGKTT